MKVTRKHLVKFLKLLESISKDGKILHYIYYIYTTDLFFNLNKVLIYDKKWGLMGLNINESEDRFNSNRDNQEGTLPLMLLISNSVIEMEVRLISRSLKKSLKRNITTSHCHQTGIKLQVN